MATRWELRVKVYVLVLINWEFNVQDLTQERIPSMCIHSQEQSSRQIIHKVVLPP